MDFFDGVGRTFGEAGNPQGPPASGLVEVMVGKGFGLANVGEDREAPEGGAACGI